MKTKKCFSAILCFALSSNLQAETLVLDKLNKVIATHSESQDITLDLYPSASKIIKAPTSILKYEVIERVDIDENGEEIKVTEQGQAFVPEGVDVSQYEAPTILEFVIPLPLVSATLGGENYNAVLAGLVSEARTLGSNVIANPKESTVSVFLDQLIYNTLPESVQEAISGFKQ